MGRPDEAASLLRQGYEPIQIAEKMGITLASVLDYLDRRIGSGDIRRSDIYFSIPPEIRKNPSRTHREILDRYRNGAAAYGDMYEDLRSIELGLHSRIRRTLQVEFGTEDTEWWREGVPEGVRKKCVLRKEADPDYCEAYCYTDVLDLADIIHKRWKFFKEALPPEIRVDRQALKRDLERLNSIRNRVMHPSRNMPPTEADFDFVRSLKTRLGDWATY